MNQIQIKTERLILKSITPAIIHELFYTKTKQEITSDRKSTRLNSSHRP